MRVRNVSPGKSVPPRMRRKVSLEARNQIVVDHQKVVFLYTNEMKMKEIRVSQIHKTALKKMASALESEGIHSAAAF